MSTPVLESHTVHVVDDDESLRTALARLLSAAGYETQLYDCAESFLLAYGPKMRGCILLDVRMPGPSGLDLQDLLNKGPRKLPIVFLSAHGDIPMSVRAMRAGAVDFLTKPVDSELLLKAVREALTREGQELAQQEMLELFMLRYSSLTPREQQVYACVVAGLPNRRIADALGTSENTVKVHRAQMMMKMQAGSVAELAQLDGLLQISRA